MPSNIYQLILINLNLKCTTQNGTYSINEIIGTISKPKIFEVDLEINDEKCIITKIK